LHVVDLGQFDAVGFGAYPRKLPRQSPTGATGFGPILLQKSVAGFFGQ
jgi:hypothetical protein